MINRPGLEKVQAHVDDAVEKGAKVRGACRLHIVYSSLHVFA